MNTLTSNGLATRVLIAFLLVFPPQGPAYATTTALMGPNDFAFSKIWWGVKEGIVVITYDLAGPMDPECEISVVLLREKDKKFRFEPVSISGDVGAGRFVGKNRVIRWDYKKDLGKDPVGIDYYVMLTLDRIGPKWPYYVAGGAVAVGGLIWIIVGCGEVILPPASFPEPPSRP